MPAPYTPHHGIGSVEPALPDGDPKNLPTWRELLDNRDYLRGVTWGLLLWNGRLSVAGSATVPVVTVGAIEACVLRRSSGAIRAFFAAETATSGKAWSNAIGYAAGDHVVSGGTVWRALGTVASGAAAPSAGPSWAEGLATDDWYYAYAISAGTDAASAMAFELSQTGPGDSVTFKNDLAPTELKRYLGCFRTDSTGKPFPVTAVRGRYRYRRSALAAAASVFGSDGLRAVDAHAAVGRTALDLAARIPPHARMALLSGTVLIGSAGAGGKGALNLYTAADTAEIALEIEAKAEGSGAIARNTSLAEVELTSAQLCGYSVTQSTATATGTVDVMGWEE